MDHVLARELPLYRESTFDAFRKRAEDSRHAFARYVSGRRDVYAYGAAAKGNTLLNWCGLDSSDIRAVGDTTPAKQGKFLPGSHIPVVSEEAIIAAQPPVLAILPWNWKHEIVTKLRPKLPRTQFVTAIPTLAVA
jgi:hypothetical protein